MAGELRLIAQIKDGEEELVGYSVLHIASNKAKMLSLAEVKVLVTKLGCANAIVKNDKLEGTEASLDRLPIYNVDGKLVAQPRVTVLAQLVEGGIVVGYFLMDAYGRKGKFTVDDAIKYIQKFESTNAKLLVKQGAQKPIISAIYGNFDTVDTKGKLKSILGNEDKAFDTGEQPSKKLVETVKPSAIGAEELVKKADKNITQCIEMHKNGKFERKYTDARYLGGKDAGSYHADLNGGMRNITYYLANNSTAKYYTVLNHIKSCEDALKAHEDMYSTRLKVPAVPMLARFLSDAVKGHTGTRYEKHYPNAMKELKVDGASARATAAKLKTFKKLALAHVDGGTLLSQLESYVNYPDAEKTALKLLAVEKALMIDCLTYRRANMSIKFATELTTIILSNYSACAYIEKSLGTACVKETLKDALVKALSNRIDGISAMMLLSVFDIIWATKSNDNSFKNSILKTIVTNVANIAKDPIDIKSENEYGAVFFQAVVIALAIPKW
jgi:hypothetical protein